MGTACSSGVPPTATLAASSSTPATPTAAAPGSPSPSPVSGPCANDYFPVVEGATRVYQLRTNATTMRAQQTFKVRGARFTSLLLSPQGGFLDMWTCGSTGLADVQTYAVTASGSPMPGVVKFHGFRSVGVTFPKNLYVGAAWTQTVTSHSDVPQPGVGHPETQTVQNSYRVVGENNLATPAGGFHVLKIELISVTHTASPSTDPNDTKRGRVVTHTVEWVARSVGIVESVARRQGVLTTMRLVGLATP
jgi:hypothetical protein